MFEEEIVKGGVWTTLLSRFEELRATNLARKETITHRLRVIKEECGFLHLLNELRILWENFITSEIKSNMEYCIHSNMHTVYSIQLYVFNMKLQYY